jgi:Raf kinase inhibitor-like YbhB/YbcL family protein
VRVWLAAVLAAPLLGGTATALTLTSSAFPPNGEIPTVHTCEGADTSPPLAWSDAPDGTKTFAMIVDDPDAPDPAAPKQTWVHWVVYDIPATTTSTAAGALPPGARPGRNDYGHDRWNGPCPPIGRHRYVHKLYALDATIGDAGPLTKAALEKAMKGHILAQADLTGTYQKKKTE